jgi:hypothetical protein
MQYDKGEWVPRSLNETFRRLRLAKDHAVAMKCCALCGGEAEFFNDLESTLDYPISGLCQGCQEKIYVEREDTYADSGVR